MTELLDIMGSIMRVVVWLAWIGFIIGMIVSKQYRQQTYKAAKQLWPIAILATIIAAFFTAYLIKHSNIKISDQTFYRGLGGIFLIEIALLAIIFLLRWIGVIPVRKEESDD